MERKLTVAISEPPSHDKKPGQTADIPANQPSGMPQKKFLPRTEQKSRLAFIPASVQKATPNTTQSNQPAKSNDDFRKMLMK